MVRNKKEVIDIKLNEIKDEDSKSSEKVWKFTDEFNPIPINENSTLINTYQEDLIIANQPQNCPKKNYICAKPTQEEIKIHDLWFQYYSDVEGLNFVCTAFSCLRKFRTISGIKMHVKKGICKINEDKRYVCPFEDCSNRYKGQSGLNYHLVYHHNIYLKHSYRDSPNS